MSKKFTPKKITKPEIAWLKKAQKLFNNQPERFEFLTSGDRNLVIIDVNFADKSELYDGAHERDGIDLGIIRTIGRVHGVSG